MTGTHSAILNLLCHFVLFLLELNEFGEEFILLLKPCCVVIKDCWMVLNYS